MIFRGITLVVWLLLIYYFSSQMSLGGSTNPNWMFYLERKGAHVFEYTVLTFLTYRFFSWSLLAKKHALHIAVLFAFCYAVSDELHQTLVMGREGKFTDVLIDSLGIVITFSFLAFKQRNKNHETKLD